MNLFAAASGALSGVNPRISATLKASDGTIVNEDFTTTPCSIEVLVTIDVQALTTSDLQQIENISQQSEMRAVYLIGDIKGLSRPLQYGGDILNFEGSDWLITQQLEAWGQGQWSKVAVTRQASTT